MRVCTAGSQLKRIIVLANSCHCLSGKIFSVSGDRCSTCKQLFLLSVYCSVKLSLGVSQLERQMINRISVSLETPAHHLLQ
jgi:hypothetical protein